MATGTINYDYDQVMEYILGTGATNLEELNSDISKLQSEIEDCQDKFHCRGSEGANVVLKIYQGFSDIMGESNYSQPDGEGLAGLCAASACFENTMYNEAKVDKNTVESIDGMGTLAGSSSVPSGSSGSTVSGIDYSTDPRFQGTGDSKVSGIDYSTDPRFQGTENPKDAIIDELGAKPLNFDIEEKFQVNYTGEEGMKHGEPIVIPDTGTINASDIDFTRIANSTTNAENGNFVNVSENAQSYWGDTTGGKIDYVKQDNGTYMLYEDGVAMGATDKIPVPTSTSSVASTPSSGSDWRSGTPYTPPNPTVTSTPSSTSSAPSVPENTTGTSMTNDEITAILGEDIFY